MALARTVTVEVHPLSRLMPDDMKRWRVLVDGEQHSVHETPSEAEAAARDCRVRLGAAWTPAAGQETRTGTAKGDWRK